ARTGWHTLWGKRYYFDPATARSLRWENRIGGSWYSFNSASEMQTGWLTWSNDRSKSYFDPANGGAMVIGQATIDGTLYDFGSDGKIRNMIMGSPRTTVDAMVRDFKSQGKSYLSQVYTAKGAPTIESFCKILYEEATAEGVRPAVLYAQVMLETGWLQFKGSSVKPEQCNFGGIGATDKDPKPATFADVRTGLRVQVQHLKAYGSTEALKNPCVDPRFHLVKRGVAPYVADLAGRWASDKEYGIKLNKLIDRVAS
ncbi:glucosaminidase domain-containing protein, partial [Adlercreutzia sp.]|uniref:glucosaminidase domain-containing protein n=1 Tax=Adlercreutzia sp. TaxID=1872387 RepID=UPI002F9255EE